MPILLKRASNTLAPAWQATTTDVAIRGFLRRSNKLARGGLRVVDLADAVATQKEARESH
jgi:hypothetical protein